MRHLLADGNAGLLYLDDDVPAQGGHHCHGASGGEAQLLQMAAHLRAAAGEGPVKRRIMDMGITRGVEVYVRKVAPLGDPMEVTVRGYELSLRRADTEMIEVE